MEGFGEGPGTGDEAHAHEGLPQAPSRWHLTGFADRLPHDRRRLSM
jgi:hypothetical protein